MPDTGVDGKDGANADANSPPKPRKARCPMSISSPVEPLLAKGSGKFNVPLAPSNGYGEVLEGNEGTVSSPM